MKHLERVFALRHGNAEGGRDPELTASGHEQARELGRSILQIISPDGISNVALMFSPLVRAKQTAQRIKEILGELVSFELELTCLEENMYLEATEMTPSLIQLCNDEHQALIVVSHFETPSGIIHSFRKKRFDVNFKRMVPNYGNGFGLCLRTGEILYLPKKAS